MPQARRNLHFWFRLTELSRLSSSKTGLRNKLFSTSWAPHFPDSFSPGSSLSPPTSASVGGSLQNRSPSCPCALHLEFGDRCSASFWFWQPFCTPCSRPASMHSVASLSSQSSPSPISC